MIVILFTESASVQLAQDRAMEIAEEGWHRNNEPFFVSEVGDVWLSNRALADQDVSDLVFETE
jgi:hypothetical protein